MLLLSVFFIRGIQKSISLQNEDITAIEPSVKKGSASTEKQLNHKSLPSKTLKDIPPEIADVLINKSVIICMAKSEMILLHYYAKKYNKTIFPTKDRETAKKYIRYCSDTLTIMDQQQEMKQYLKYLNQKPSDNLHIGEHTLIVYDPRHIYAKVNRQELLTKRCRIYQTIADNQWHNFLIYYMCQLRQGKDIDLNAYCNLDQVTHSIQKQFYSIFNRNDYFVELDRFLQQFGFRKNPKSRGEFWTVLYFDYLVQAFDKGHINMVLREFLEGMDSSLKQRFPEVKYLRNYLILLQREKLIQ